jgi:DNA transformation protein
MKDDLINMPDIGRTLADKLKNVGIYSPRDLITTGSENAMIKIETVDHETCINMLYALEGAIQGIRWHDLDDGRKTELKEFYDRLLKKHFNNE